MAKPVIDPSARRTSTGGERFRRPTAADVARRAGVSRATVSYVLNDTPHQAIPSQTRERVRAAAADLGYSPSAAARTLITGRSEVALLLPPDRPIGPASAPTETAKLQAAGIQLSVALFGG